MVEQSTENSFSQDSSIKTGQVRSQNGNKLHQRSVTDDIDIHLDLDSDLGSMFAIYF